MATSQLPGDMNFELVSMSQCACCVCSVRGGGGKVGECVCVCSVRVGAVRWVGGCSVGRCTAAVTQYRVVWVGVYLPPL